MKSLRNFLIKFSQFDLTILKYSELNKSEYESIGLFYVFQFLFLFVGQTIIYFEFSNVFSLFSLIWSSSICITYYLYKKAVIDKIETSKIYKVIIMFVIAIILSLLNSIPFLLLTFEYEINQEYFKQFNISNLTFFEKINGLRVLIKFNEAKDLLIIIFSSIFLFHGFVFIYPLILKIKSKKSIYSKYKSIYEQIK